MQLIDTLFVIAVIVMSAVVHEVSHGVASDWLGDKTARYAGRLTLNPFKHLDPVGSVILPLVFAITNSPVLFGWAKPVPYNPYNLRAGRFSEAIVAGAGPASNIVIAVFMALLIRSALVPTWTSILFTIVAVNVMLCIFNLIPVPPLDGSKILSAILPSGLAHRYGEWRVRLEYNPFFGFGIVLVIVIMLGGTFGAAVLWLARFLAGV